MFDEFRILKRGFPPLHAPETQQTRWQPAADIYRTSEGWLIKLDLAGVRKSEIEVHVRDRTLVVEGSRRDWAVVEGRRECYSLEIAYSHFERSFELPCDLSSAEIVSEYRDGMLFLRIITEGAGA